MNNWNQLFSRGSITFLSAAALEAWWRRPQPDPKDGTFSRRNGWMSINSQTENAGRSVSIFMHGAKNVSINIVALTGRCWMHSAGKFHVNKDENYYNLIRRIKSRDPGVSLITVANHRSVCDDAFLMGSIMPLWMTMQAKFHRWGICTQEICFEVNLTYTSPTPPHSTPAIPANH